MLPKIHDRDVALLLRHQFVCGALPFRNQEAPGIVKTKNRAYPCIAICAIDIMPIIGGRDTSDVRIASVGNKPTMKLMRNVIRAQFFPAAIFKIRRAMTESVVKTTTMVTRPA